MPCSCARFEEAFYLDDAPKGFQKKLVELEAGNWMRLYQCPACDALWAIDEWDKYMVQVVTRVGEREGWDSDPAEDKRKELLRRSRGGEEEEECIWAGCKKQRIRGVTCCIDHLYATGARR